MKSKVYAVSDDSSSEHNEQDLIGDEQGEEDDNGDLEMISDQPSLKQKLEAQGDIQFGQSSDDNQSQSELEEEESDDEAPMPMPDSLQRIFGVTTHDGLVADYTKSEV